VNFVIGFRPELWRNVVPDDASAGVEGFNGEIRAQKDLLCQARNNDALVMAVRQCL
jgi:porphyrinogen peroxidase